jgi:hypothetical protein
MRGTSVAMFLAFLSLPSGAHAQPVAVESLPPVVVKTVPQSGDLAVDPSLKEISVTFSKDMTTVEMWSWAEITPDSFPKLAGKPHYLGDRRTCVLPVKLEPGKTYAIWVNSTRYDNFRDQGDRPAVPYLLVFRTKA